MPKDATKPKVCTFPYYLDIIIPRFSIRVSKLVIVIGAVQCCYLRTDHAYIPTSHILTFMLPFPLNCPLLSRSSSLLTLPSPQRKAAEKSAAKSKPAKAKKDKNAPKRALSAYMFFSQDWRERIKTENPDAGFGTWSS
jgi:hypothetical protein